MPTETKIFSVAGLVPLLDQNLPKHQPNLTSAYRAKTHFFCKLTEPFSTSQVFNSNPWFEFPTLTAGDVRERNFGRTSTIWQSRTSSNKGPLEGSRQARRRLKPTKRNLSRFNRCSTGAFARACALSFVGEISGYAVWKLDTLKHIFDRRATGARNSEHLCAHKIIRPAFRLALQGFTSEGFYPENLQSNLPSHPKRI